MQAQYPVKVQAIRSKGRTDRFYVFIPLPLAAAIGLEAGEEFQWSLSDRQTLAVRRLSPTSTTDARTPARKKRSRPN
jgi:hypothetical protein